MAKFHPKDHMTKMSGRDYLEVKWRLVWFREVHPAGTISTELIATEPTVVVRAQVHGADGVILASGYGTAPAAGKGTWIGRAVEKAETAAIGRALAHAGFGTQFDADDDGDNLADTPVEPARKAQHAPNGWTKEQFEKLKWEASQAGITDLPGLLGVARVSEYSPGFNKALELVRAHANAKAGAK